MCPIFNLSVAVCALFVEIVAWFSQSIPSTETHGNVLTDYTTLIKLPTEYMNIFMLQLWKKPECFYKPCAHSAEDF